MRTLKYVALLVLISPVILLFLVVAIPTVVVMALCRWIWLRAFCYRHRGRVVAVLTRRHGWREFLANNLTPILPPDVMVVWQGRRLFQQRGALVAALRMTALGLRRPYLALITPFGLRGLDLHVRLLPYKPLGKRKPAVQAEVSEVVRRAIAELRG